MPQHDNGTTFPCDQCGGLIDADDARARMARLESAERN